MIAFVDESCQEWPPGVYVLAAVIVAPDRLDTVRRSARETGAVRGRFHWHEADEQRRRKYLKSLTGFGLTAVVVVASPIAPRRPERARRKCLTTLLWELQGRGVQRVVFESRQEHQDRADRVALGAAVRAGTLTRDLAYEFGQPAQEPLLWLPDAIAGAVSATWSGRTPSYLHSYETWVTVIPAEDAR